MIIIIDRSETKHNNLSKIDEVLEHNFINLNIFYIKRETCDLKLKTYL